MTSIAVPSTQSDHHQTTNRNKNSSRSYANNVVWLNVYDISFHNDYLLPLLGVGIFHSAIEVYGVEFGFGRSAGGNGVFAIEPQSFPNHVYRESFALGVTSLSETEIFTLQKTILHKIWPGDGYHILCRNCNHYSQELGKVLTMAKDFEMAQKWGQSVIDRVIEEVKSENPEAVTRQQHHKLEELVMDKFRSTKAMMASGGGKLSMVPSTYSWDSEEGRQVMPEQDGLSDVTYGGRISIFKVLKHALFSSSSSTTTPNSNNSIKLSYDDEIYPQWVNRIVRFATTLLSKKQVLSIENQDRAAAGMDPLEEE